MFLMSVLMDESCQRREYGPMGASRWPLTFPLGEDLFRLSSIVTLVEGNTTPITEETIEQQEGAILADVKVYQREIRRNFIANVSRSSATQLPQATADPLVTAFGDGKQTGLDTQSVVAAEATDIIDEDVRMLSNPTILLHCPSPIHFGDWALNYPDIVQPYLESRRIDKNIDRHATDMFGIQPHREATRIAEVIVKSSPTIKNLEQSVLAYEDAGGRFVCLCCPKVMRKGYSWRKLASL